MSPLSSQITAAHCVPCLPTFLPAGELCSLLLSRAGAGSGSAPCCRNALAPRSARLGHRRQVRLALITCRDLQQSHTSQMFGVAANSSLPASEAGRPGSPIPAFSLLTGNWGEIAPSMPGWQCCRFGKFVLKITSVTCWASHFCKDPDYAFKKLSAVMRR